MTDSLYTWVPFEQELVARLADYEDRQPELVAVLTKAGVKL
mgnify:CR=1 FL=1